MVSWTQICDISFSETPHAWYLVCSIFRVDVAHVALAIPSAEARSKLHHQSQKLYYSDEQVT